MNKLWYDETFKINYDVAENMVRLSPIMSGIPTAYDAWIYSRCSCIDEIY